MDQFSRSGEYITIERCKISLLFFADKLVLLAFYEYDLQYALSAFEEACDYTGIKITLPKPRYFIFSEIKSMFSASWQSIIAACGEV